MSDLFQKAKAADLTKLVKNLTTQETDKATCECPVCIKGNTVNLFKRGVYWQFKCTSCNASGDSIDYVGLRYGLNAQSSANKILELQPQSHVTEPINRADQNQALFAAARSLYHKGHTSVKEVLDWAKMSCNIDSQRFVSLALDGYIRMLPVSFNEASASIQAWVGQELLVKSSLLKEGNKCPAAVFRPLMLFSRNFQAVQFISLTRDHPLFYGEVSQPIEIQKGIGCEILLVNDSLLGLKSIGEGYSGMILSAPNGNWKDWWFEEEAQRDPNVVFNLQKLPEKTAAEIASLLKYRQIRFL
jgi:hypothetical protein